MKNYYKLFFWCLSQLFCEGFTRLVDNAWAERHPVVVKQ